MPISSSALFKGISEKARKKIEKCLRMHIMDYKKGQTVCSYGDGSERIGIVLSGRASLLRTDYNGYESLLENLPKGAIFSESMSYAKTAGDSIIVRSMSDCSIAYLDYERILSCPNGCKSVCGEQEILKQNLIELLTVRSRILSERVEVLACHSIREKLMCFFRLRLNGADSGKLEMPFTLVELATYINADRSAMMRELGAMKKAGHIEVFGSSVRVFKTH